MWPAASVHLVSCVLQCNTASSRYAERTSVMHKLPRRLPLHSNNRYVLRAGLLDTLETTLGTLHVVVVGDAAGESGHSVGGWNAEMLKSERRSAPISRRPLNRIALNYETTACVSVRVYVQIFCHDTPRRTSLSLFSLIVAGIYPSYIIHEAHPCICPAIYLILISPIVNFTYFSFPLSLSLELESFTEQRAFQRVFLNLILFEPFNYIKYRR